MKKSLMITFLSMKKALLMKKLILCAAVLVLMLTAARSLAEDTGRTVTLPINASERKDYQPFMEDEDITDILVAEGNEAFISIDGVLFTADGKELLLYPTGRMEETYIVPEGTERIDDECAFNYGCQLKTLILPASLKSFCKLNLFRTVITDYRVAPDNLVYCDVDGVLYSKDRKTLIAYPPGRLEESFTVPEGTEAIGPGAFNENEHVQRVVAPDSLQAIGDDAFSGSVLESIRLPDQMTAIGWGAFSQCYNLSDFRLPEGLKEIPGSMLLETDMRGALRIPEGVTFIGDEALCFLTKLTDISWPDSLAILAGEEWMETWDMEFLSMVYGWNDWGIMDYTAVMHAHEGTKSAEWVRNYPHVISPQGTDTMDVEGYATAVTAAMQAASYTDAVLCDNPEVKWMAVKPLIAYNLHHAVAVFRQGERTLLCGFDDMDGAWELRWVNEAFFDNGNLPAMLAYYGEEELRIVLPDTDDPDNAVDYRFDPETLALQSANYVEGYLWYEDSSIWYCVPEDGSLAYSTPEIRWNETGRVRTIGEAEPFRTVPVEDSQLSLRTMRQVPEPQEQEKASDDFNNLTENVAESNLIGTWQFVGGGKVMGDGFRLNADGTGRCLEANYDEGYLKLLWPTDTTFIWQCADGVFTVSFGRSTHYDYPITRYDHCIHFAEGEGGGFYQKYDEEVIRAEIEERIQNSTADEFDNLAMDAIDGTMTARLEAIGLTEVTAQLNWEAPLPFILVGGLDAETHFRVALRFTPCAIGVWAGDEFWDVTQIPVSYYETYLRSVDMGVYEDAYRVIQSELAVASQRQQALFSMPGLTGYVGQFPRGKTYEVYRGPGREFSRSANGKASVSTNDTIWIYGVRGDWMLISYGISGGHTRYGWISTAGLPESMLEFCPELVFPGDDGTDYVYATVRENARMVDVLDTDQDFIYPLQPGDSVHCLAEMQGWVLVETYAYDEPYWGFVRRESLDTRHGYAFTSVNMVEAPGIWPEELIRDAMQAVADAYTGRAAGHTLISLRYSDEDNIPENWPTDYPEDIDWMKLYGTARSISYYDFEIASSDGTAEDLAFYVWREPGGEWIGGIGGYE